MSDSMMAGRWRVQLLAAVIRLCMRGPDGKPVQMSNEDALAIADTELSSMMATDVILQARAEDEVQRAVQEDKLLHDLLEHRKKNLV